MNLHKHASEIAYLPMVFCRNYPHRLHKGYHYTDQVRENMLERASSWVVDRIFTLQDDERAVKTALIQHWDLKILPDGAVLLTCSDKEGGEIIHYEYGYPHERPDGDLSFVLYRNILQVKNRA